jgi:hypothetical protein
MPDETEVIHEVHINLQRKLEHEIALEDLEAENKLSSCCGGSTDKRLLEHASRLFISILVLTFTFAQMIRSEPNDAMLPFYTSLLTFVLGNWLSGSKEQVPKSK